MEAIILPISFKPLKSSSVFAIIFFYLIIFYHQ
jgi:hypothetical protein